MSKGIHQKHEENQANRKKVKGIMLDALEGGNISIDDHASSNMEEGLNDLLHNFETEEDFKKRLGIVTETREKFIACLGSFCDAMGIQRKD